MKTNEQWKWADNQIGHEGAQSLSETVKTNTILTQKYLDGDDDIEC